MGDNTKTFRVGKVSEEADRLLKVTEEAMFKGIEQAVAGNRIGDISNAIQTHVEANGYAVCRKYIGHGSGVRCTRIRRSRISDAPEEVRGCARE